MQKELEDLQPKLVLAKEENSKMMVVIEKENVEVEARSKVVRKNEEAANKEAAAAQALKDEVRPSYILHVHSLWGQCSGQCGSM